jgi:hypothetical protein
MAGYLLTVHESDEVCHVRVLGFSLGLSYLEGHLIVSIVTEITN